MVCNHEIITYFKEHRVLTIRLLVFSKKSQVNPITISIM